MGSPYASTAVTGYNINPPPDDGTTAVTNKITWSGIKTKIGDPLNVFAGALNTVLVSSFARTIDGGTLVSTAVSYAMTSADQGRFIKATASGITITTPDATAVLSPFVFVVSNQSTGTITLAGNATGAQTVDGQTTQVIKAGSGCLVFTDGSNWYTSGLKAAQLQSTNPPYGFTDPINLGLVATTGSNLLTVAVKTNSGADPTPSDPILIPFRDSTTSQGDPVWVAVTSALSINTNGVGASLGSGNAKAFRFWVVAFNNGGTPVLALINCLGATQVFPLNDRLVQSAVGISAAATSAGVYYCPNGTTITSKSLCVLGYIEYDSSGLATAGTYNNPPTFIQLAGPSTARPGHSVQSVSSVSAATAQSSFALSISPTSAANAVKMHAGAQVVVNNVSLSITYKRVAVTLHTQTINNGVVSNVEFGTSAVLFD